MSFFDNKIAIVTGSASGIGQALAILLAQQGAEVVLADIQLDAATATAETITAKGGKAMAHYLDVTDNDAVENFVQNIAAKLGRLDFMFNNAGVTVNGDFSHLPSADWKHILDVNVGGVFAGTAAAYAVMIRQGHGHIVNTASLSGLIPVPGIVAYCASKHAVVGLSTSLRIEAAAHGVRVSAVCPGFIKTPLFDSKTVGDLPTSESSARIVKWAMPPEECAVKMLAGVEKNKAIITITRHAKILGILHRFCPGLLRAAGRRAASDRSDQEVDALPG
ncbi:MAG: NAD(P)-dependent dehydrogenase (short-subunit alcohol dehydrogenase family) [Verrucomicrobiales bacterium]|jgi:NAD(P)-dependent dehydrogenase (short-subunit alcohol dehydrogenase family)